MSQKWLFYATAHQLQDVSTAWAMFCLQTKTPMLARDDKPGAQGVDVTAPCDRRNFRSLTISFKSDVALKHVFTKYQSRKNHRERGSARPARRKKVTRR